METRELFAKVIQERNWYKSLGCSAQHAMNYKMRFNNGSLSETTMSKILTKLGYEKKIIWEKD